jgi:hypothetical protein
MALVNARIIVRTASAAVILLAVLGVGGPCHAQANPTPGGYVEADFSVILPVKAVPVNNVKGAAVFGPCNYMTFPGRPRLPVDVVEFLLPEDVDPTSVRAVIKDAREETLDGQWTVAPAGPLTLFGPKRVTYTPVPLKDGKDPSVYSRNSFFPASTLGRTVTGSMRIFNLAQIEVFPYRYNPVTGRLRRVSGGTLVLQFARRPLPPTEKPEALSVADLKALHHVGNTAANVPAMEKNGSFRRYYPGFVPTATLRPSFPRTVPLPTPVPRSTYLILTTDTIKNRSHDLVNFIRAKEERFFDVLLATETHTYEYKDGGLSVMGGGGWGGGAGDVAAENVRAWLKQEIAGGPRWRAWKIEYLLLLGSPHPESGSPPMKRVSLLHDTNVELGRRNQTQPTDFYYAELTSNWDPDGDGRAGELDATWNAPFDLHPELAVGRIPVARFGFGVETLDPLLRKLIAYEAAPEGQIDWRRSVLLPMKPIAADENAWRVGESIKVIADFEGFASHRLYDSISIFKIRGLLDAKIEQQHLDPERTHREFEAVVAAFHDDLWYADEVKWRQVANRFGLLFNDAFTGAPANAETIPCSVNGVRAAWTGRPFGMVVWYTHGTDVMAENVFETAFVNELDDTHPAVVFAASCLNGFPENESNVASSLLGRGAVAVVASTDVSIGGTTGDLAVQWSIKALHLRRWAGDASFETLVENFPLWEDYNFFVFNLFGDPAIGVWSSRP